jgi:hypothetical protein
VRARERRDRLREQLGEAQGPCDFTPPVGWSGGLSRPHYAGAELTRTLAAETLALMRRRSLGRSAKSVQAAEHSASLAHSKASITRYLDGARLQRPRGCGRQRSTPFARAEAAGICSAR